jgi:uncharacterized membrane protein
MVASSMPLPPVAAEPTPLALQWGEVVLFLRSGGELSPAPPGATELPATTFTTATWTMPEGLAKGLCIEAGEPGSGTSSFPLVMNLTALPQPSGPDWNLAVHLYDEDTIIAQETRVVPPGTGGFYPLQSDFHLDYSSNRTGCQVLKGHHLKVEVVSSRSAGVTGRGWQLSMWAQDVLAPTISTENAAGPTDTFYPNDLDGSRSVIVKGQANNAFPASLVTAIRVGVEGPGGGAVANGTTTLQDDNFTYTWSYNRGISGGPYTIRTEVEDRQGNIFVATTTVIMAAYGLRITTPGQQNQSVTGYTIPGEPARYDLTVTNTGAQPTTVLMVTENPPVSGWSIAFSSDNFGLAPGASNVTVFRTTPGGLIQPGNSAQATVVAQARDDPSAIKARGTLLTTTIVIREAALLIDPAATDATIRLAGSVEYEFHLTNNGGLATDVTLEATDAPTGWLRSLSGTSVVPDGDGWKVLGMPAGSQLAIRLNVSAPVESTSTDEFVCVVTARAVGNASVVATFTATTQLLLGIELSQASPTNVPAIAPGNTAEFQVDVVNTDPLQRHTITQAGTTVVASPGNPQAVPGAGAPEVQVFAPADGTCCDPHSSSTISVFVQMPAKALPGRYTFELSTVVDGSLTQVATLNLSVDVTRVTAIRIVPEEGLGKLVAGDGPVRFEVTLYNDGNGAVVLDLTGTVADARNDENWKITFANPDGSEVPDHRVSLDPYTSRTVTVVVNPPKTTFHGDERHVSVHADQIGGNAKAELPAPVDVTVELEPMDRLVRILSAQWMFVFVLAFTAWGVLTLGWGRTIWRRTHGRASPAPTPPPPPRAP